MRFLLIWSALLFQLAAIMPIRPVLAENPLDLQNQQGFQQDIPQAFGEAGQPADPRIIASNIIKIVLGFLGVIFLGLLVYAGFKYMTAAGNEDSVADAKKIIIQAVIGLVIVISAYSLTVFISNHLLNAVGQPLNRFQP